MCEFRRALTRYIGDWRKFGETRIWLAKVQDEKGCKGVQSVNGLWEGFDPWLTMKDWGNCRFPAKKKVKTVAILDQ